MTFNEELVEERARSYFGGLNPAHDWFHVKRVCRLAETIAEAEGANTTTVRLAALLHDIGRGMEDRGEVEDHATWGATEAGDILRDFRYEGNRIEEVQHCIHAHRYSRAPEPRTLEARVLADADNLDALGATGIARAFTYGGEHETTIADPGFPAKVDDSPDGETSLNHLEKKILNLRERMYTEMGREMAADRHEYVATFVERFKAEIAGRR